MENNLIRPDLPMDAVKKGAALQKHWINAAKHPEHQEVVQGDQADSYP